jgi:hypothetical protein
MSNPGTVSDETIRAVVTELIDRLGDQFESLLYYPHPFTGPGLVVVVNANVRFVPNLIAEVYSCVPPGMPFYCLRSNELFHLSIPGQFIDGMASALNDHPHVAFWARHKGAILYGRDIRDQIILPVKRREFLFIHIERCYFYLRNMAVLYLLTKHKYGALINELDKHLRHVMATALLLHDEWEVSAEDVPARFEQKFSDDQLQQIWRAWRELLVYIETVDEASCRESGFEAAWLFESFLRRLEGYAR